MLVGCGPGSREEGGEADQTTTGSVVELVDASGAILALPRVPERILSLVPAVTRTLLALGAGELLVGRTDYDTLASLAHLPSVGGGLQPSLEALVALEPALVVRFAGDSDRDTPPRLDALGIPHFAVRLDGIADVRRMILDLGLITGRGAVAAGLVFTMNSTLDEIRGRTRGRDPVRVAYVLGESPPWVAGPESYIHELIILAGGENVFADLQSPYGPVSPEEFLVRDIDLLLTPDPRRLHLPAADLPVGEVPPHLEMPGPELALAAWGLAELLHPEAFR
jgi:iron complex transport system substrate-binding protein